jgi:hypothetical protein
VSRAPISPLLRRMIEDMTVRGCGEKTQSDYIRHVRNFTLFVGRSPDQTQPEDLRRLIHEVTVDTYVEAAATTPARSSGCGSALRQAWCSPGSCAASQALHDKTELEVGKTFGAADRRELWGTSSPRTGGDHAKDLQR